MPFKPDPNATISSGELANRDATYMIVRFIHKDGPHRKESSTFGLSTSGGGCHAEDHFFNWCANAGNAATLQLSVTVAEGTTFSVRRVPLVTWA
jgi:hypothetical protein